MARGRATSAGHGKHIPWPVVHGAAAVNFSCFGCAYAMAVYFPSLRQEFALESWELTSLFSLVGGIYFGVGTLSGKLTDRFGARPLITIGMLLQFVCLVLASMAQSPGQFALAYLLGIGLGVGLSYVPSLAAVQTHAGQYAALASGLASSGIGVGTMIVPPACALLIEYAGWRVTLFAMAVLAALGFLGSRPLVPAGVVMAPARRAGPLVRSTRFGLLYVAYLGIGLVAFVPMANVVPYVASKGLPGKEAAFLLALVGSGSILGRIGFGLMGEYTGARRASVQCAVFIALSFVGLAMKDDVMLLQISMLLFGLGYGGVTGLTAPATAEIMGMEHFGGVLGALMTSRAVGILFGPSLTAILASLTTSYETPYMICGVIAACSAALLHAERWTKLAVPEKIAAQ